MKIAATFLWLSCTLCLWAQEQPVQTPPSDLRFVLGTKDGRTHFHVGEIIEIDLAFSSSTPGEYRFLTGRELLNVGHSAQLTMQPETGVTDRFRENGVRSAFAVLHTNCKGLVFGRGVGGCADCDGSLPLGPTAVHFPYALTNQFQILQPGRYSVNARAGNVVLAGSQPENITPISLTSNTLEIDIEDDPLWSDGQFRAAAKRYETARTEYAAKGLNSTPAEQTTGRSLEQRLQVELEMSTAAELIRRLDTEQSLAWMASADNGSEHLFGYYYNAFYQGIIQSKHSELAVKLLGERMLRPDFPVSSDLMDQLTAMSLNNRQPDVSRSNNEDILPSLYPEARAILHDYVESLGQSLRQKNTDALEASLKTFSKYATEDFCTGEPLIPADMYQQMLRQAGVPGKTN